MNLILLNYPYLQNELKEMGHNLVSIGDYDSCDFTIPILSFEKITELIDITQFDIIIYSDGLDKHPLVTNFSKFNIPKVYISIDSTINYFWQKHFIMCFDIVFVDQLAVYEKMRLFHKNVIVLLLSHDEKVFSKHNIFSKNKTYDITFVGRINENTRIKRSNILNQIKDAGFKLNLIDGSNKTIADQSNLSKIYNQSKIVLNESLFPSINLRLFEALGSGSLLFTEESDSYIKEYFQDKKHLIYYNQDNLIERLKYYLSNDRARELIAQKGHESASKYHKDSDRAKFLIEIIEENLKDIKLLQPKSSYKENISLALSALYLNLKWNDSKNSIPTRSLFNQNTEIIYHTTKKISDYSYSELSNQDICSFLKLLYSINENEKIDTILFNKIELLQLNRKPDAELIQFLFFYSLEKKNSNIEFTNIISFIFNHLIFLDFTEESEKHLIKQNCLTDEKYYYFYFAEYLDKLGELDKINFGFTQTNISPIFFTVFDLYHFCMQVNNSFEKSTLGMIKFLILAKAYDNISILYDILYKKYPMNEYYKDELKKYRHLAYSN